MWFDEPERVFDVNRGPVTCVPGETNLVMGGGSIPIDTWEIPSRVWVKETPGTGPVSGSSGPVPGVKTRGRVSLYRRTEETWEELS